MKKIIFTGFVLLGLVTSAYAVNCMDYTIRGVGLNGTEAHLLNLSSSDMDVQTVQNDDTAFKVSGSWLCLFRSGSLVVTYGYDADNSCDLTFQFDKLLQWNPSVSSICKGNYQFDQMTYEGSYNYALYFEPKTMAVMQ